MTDFIRTNAPEGEIHKVIDNGNGYFTAYHRVIGVAIYGETIEGRDAAEKRLDEILADRHNCIDWVVRNNEAMNAARAAA